MQRLIRLVTDHLQGDRKDAMLAFLETVPGLASAPASSKVQYHHCYNGGLLEHILEVFETCQQLAGNNMTELPLKGSFEIDGNEYHTASAVDSDSILMVSILHDIHKVTDISGNEQYEPNILKSGAVSDKIPYKVNKSCFSFSEVSNITDVNGMSEPNLDALRWLFTSQKLAIKNGGIKSLALVAGFCPRLFDLLLPYELEAIEFHGGAYETSKFELAGKENPLTILFHCADMLSSRFGRTKQKI